MLWVAEGRRSQVLPVVLAAVAGALVLALRLLRLLARRLQLPLPLGGGIPLVLPRSALALLHLPPNAGITVAAAAAALLYLALRRSRYFGNTTPLVLCFGLSSCW